MTQKETEMLTLLIMKVIKSNMYSGEFDMESCEKEIKELLERFK